MRTVLRPAALLVAVSLLVGACTPDDDGTAEPNARAEAIQAARAQLGPPASTLGTATLSVEDRLTEAADRGSMDAVDALDAALDELNAVVADARGAATDVEAEAGDVEDVATAAGALAGGADAGARLEEHARQAADVLARLADIDAALDEFVTTWNAAGSRSEQMTRFQQLADEAAAYRQELAAEAQDVSGCEAPFEVRVEAAAAVAEASAELADLAGQGQGSAFDDRRAELAEDPYGFGQPLTDERPVDASTCAPIAAAREAADEVTAALERLETALNPPELEG